MLRAFLFGRTHSCLDIRPPAEERRSVSFFRSSDSSKSTDRFRRRKASDAATQKSKNLPQFREKLRHDSKSKFKGRFKCNSFE
jgi:hypothetical protein